MEFRFNLCLFSCTVKACELDKIDITDAVEQYENDLFNADIIDLEIRMWLRMWRREIPAEKRPNNISI